MAGIDVPIGPATVEYGDVSGGTGVTFDITKGGIQFQASTSKQDVTVDQYGDSVVKSIIKGRTAEVTVPFALNDLTRLAEVIPNSTLVTDSVDQTKKQIKVNGDAGFDMLAAAQKLVIKPTDPSATANDWVTIPLAGVVTDPELQFDSDSERVYNVTFTAYPDIDSGGLLFILGDETAAGA